MIGYSHRVRSAEGLEGINVFLRLHGDAFPWPDTWTWDLMKEHPGDIRWRKETVKPGGNTVLAYLDILAPDNTPEQDVAEVLDHLFLELAVTAPSVFPSLPNPLLFQRRKGSRADTVTVRFGVSEDLLSRRAEEFTLLRAALDPPKTPAPWRGFAHGPAEVSAEEEARRAERRIRELENGYVKPPASKAQEVPPELRCLFRPYGLFQCSRMRLPTGDWCDVCARDIEAFETPSAPLSADTQKILDDVRAASLIRDLMDELLLYSSPVPTVPSNVLTRAQKFLRIGGVGVEP